MPDCPVVPQKKLRRVQWDLKSEYKSGIHIIIIIHYRRLGNFLYFRSCPQPRKFNTRNLFTTDINSNKEFLRSATCKLVLNSPVLRSRPFCDSSSLQMDSPIPKDLCCSLLLREVCLSESGGARIDKWPEAEGKKRRPYRRYSPEEHFVDTSVTMA